MRQGGGCHHVCWDKMGGACFVGRDIFVSGSTGAAGWDDNDDDFVFSLYPWWLVG